MSTLVPSIFLQEGICVQKIPCPKNDLGYTYEQIGNGDVFEVLARLTITGPVLVVDLTSDPAASCSSSCPEKRSNIPLLLSLIDRFSLYIYLSNGMDTDTAFLLLNRGARKVVIDGTGNEDLFSLLPKDRVIGRISVCPSKSGDQHGYIEYKGIQKNSEDENSNPKDLELLLKSNISEMTKVAGSVLVHVLPSQRSGKMEYPYHEIGKQSITPFLEFLSEIGCTVYVSGSLCCVGDVGILDQKNLYSIVGTALTNDSLNVGEVICSFLKSDRVDGLFPTVVVDEHGVALGMVYSDDASICEAISKRKGIYHSRRRGLWEKGLSSGDTQTLLRVDMDCDRDTLRYTVIQNGRGFCHKGVRTCWDHDNGIGELFRTLESRRHVPVAGSYTQRLFQNHTLLQTKLREEVEELIEAKEHQDIVGEAADVLYFWSVLCVGAGVSLEEVERKLQGRSLRVTRRKGDAKPAGHRHAPEALEQSRSKPK